jgi:hypothetical protein
MEKVNSPQSIVRGGKIAISRTRFEQFNKMVEICRTIRTYDVRKQVAALKREGHSKEEAQALVIRTLQNIAVESRGISELKEVSND